MAYYQMKLKKKFNYTCPKKACYRENQYISLEVRLTFWSTLQPMKCQLKFYLGQ